ncbi:Fur family transcriptional regulator [Calditerrivibrio nitroreducens]|uniref:Transcriptional repressor n=1 Tax=Calditerrivibrio nitroreducens (strain DSM 19672 / NBRC 101217 / Yu37-1) TaxID=768670 RepID=E4TGT1_CALNY|nr:transcriptional repressor [Calditerrivibrio nitroreducens]ADR18691.1 hypothetical protein Calni_0780 [Calditerrivibrio nitroreducens DSM 19672]
MSEGNAEEILKRFNIRPNRNRIKVLNAIIGRDHTVSAVELISDLKDIDKTTIYRTLDLFEKKMIIMKDVDLDGVGHYCIRSKPNDPHTHFYCRECHKTMCKEIDKSIELNIVDEMVDSIEIKIVGVCKDCLQKKRS